MASLESFLQKRLRLKVNRDKSAVARPWERTFLGYTFTVHRQSKLKISPRSIQRLKGKLRPFWRWARGRKLTDTIGSLTPILRGWVAYFRRAEVKTSLRELDAWIRRKLRAVLWRQWKTPSTRLKRLRQHGVDPGRAWAGAMNSRGPWWNAGASHTNQAVPNEMLHNMGLVSLLDEHRRLARAA
jgi:RNA-directed DNA polymerase